MGALARAWPALLLTALALLALGFRLHGIGWGLPEVYEEAYPFKSAWNMWGWGPQREFTLNPNFFRYPSLTIYLQFLGQAALLGVLWIAGAVRSAMDIRIFFELDKTPFYVTGRTITALLGAATVPLASLIAWRVTMARDGVPRGAGFLAAGLAGLVVAVSGPSVAKAQEIEVDVPLTCAVAAAVLLALRLQKRPTVANAALAGAAVGLATSCKYTGLIALLPCVLALMLAEAQEPAAAGGARSSRGKVQSRKGGSSTPRRFARTDFLITRGGTLLVATLLALLLTSPYLALDTRSFLHDLGEERQHMELGHFGVPVGTSWLYYLEGLAARHLGWPLAAAALAGLVGLALVRRERAALVVAAVPTAYLLVVGSWSMKADRYLLPIVPLAAALAGAMIGRMVMRVGSPSTSARTRVALGGLAAILFIAPLAPGLRDAWGRTRPDPRTEARQWIEANVPAGAFIVTELYGPNLLSHGSLIEMQPDLVAEFARRHQGPPLYGLLQMPMFQVKPERSAAFYELDLYHDADLFIVTEAVRSRYAGDTVLFAPQLRFYDELERRFERVREFRSAPGAAPEIVLYRDRSRTNVFAERDSVLGPGPYRGVNTTGESFYFHALGMIYESAGHYALAASIYAEGLGYPPSNQNLYRRLAQRTGHCLFKTRTREEAMALAERARETATSGECAAAWKWIEDEFASGKPWFAEKPLPSLAAAKR